MTDDGIVIQIDTPSGTYLRSVRPATLLPEGVDRGPLAEAATRGAAALYGLPDFVFHPAIERRGPGIREVGDALLVTGHVGAVVQVKARQQATENMDRERAWLTQHAEAGARQAIGTIRRLQEPRPMQIESLRGDVVEVSGADISWVPVVVLEHSSPPADLELTHTAVVLLRRDWEFLFEQLQSTVAVVDYLHRVSTMPPVALGLEAVRYYELAQADAAVPAQPGDPGLADLVARDESAPVLPLEPAARANLIRWILEDIGEVPTTTMNPDQKRKRLSILAAIDRAPITVRAQMAEAIISWLTQVQTAPPEAVWWRFRHYIYFGRVHLIIGVTNQNRPVVREAFGHLVRLRHVERGERSPHQAEVETVGVLLQPRAGGQRPWDTTAGMAEGVITLGADERALAEEIWGSLAEGVRRAERTGPLDAFREEL